MSIHRILSGFVALTAVTTLLHCNHKKSSSTADNANEPTCSGGQALQSIGLRGQGLAAKTLALTFDDGPGPRTKQLSQFLRKEGIRAAFFVNGRQMGPDAAEILQGLADDGHLVANHTETHRSLTGVTVAPRPSDAEIVQELAATDEKIAKYVSGNRWLFRPPFGDWDDSALAALSGTPMNKYIGPVLWDIGDMMDAAKGRVADWDCWQEGTDAKRIPMKECGDLYVTEIKHATRGIVLMHDPYFNELDPEQLGTVDMVMYIVPILKAEGFSFVRVDEVPEVAALLPPIPDGGLPPVESEGGPAASGENGGPAATGEADPCK